MADRSAQTEQPTQRRLEKARREGQFAQAKEFVSAVQFLAVVGLLSVAAPAWVAGFCETARALFRVAFVPELTTGDILHVAWTVVVRQATPLAAAGLGLAAATVAF